MLIKACCWVQLRVAREAANAWIQQDSPEQWVDRYGTEARQGSDILVQALEREGCHRVFAYPGGASLEIHQALTRSPMIKNILCRHEQVCHWCLQMAFVSTGIAGFFLQPRVGLLY